jgi:ABC-type amino acid transport substrate-binding protein
MGYKIRSRCFGIQVFSIAVSLLLLILAVPNIGAADLDTIKPGTLVVAFNGDMPGTGWQDGKMIGLDGELMQWIADELGLKVEPALMEWSAEIASLKARRVDVMHGMMSWSIPRTKVIALTDPVYYVKPTITQKKGQDWSTLKDLEGKRVATITGFNWIDELKRIPGLKLSLYDTSDAAARDLLAGRVEALLADPPLIQYAIAKNPDWQIHSIPIGEERDDFPILTIKQNIVFGLNKEAPLLLDAMNKKIREAWQTCKNFEIAKKYGLGDVSTWFEPPGKEYRPGVDRPEGWTHPKLPASCQ